MNPSELFDYYDGNLHWKDTVKNRFAGRLAGRKGARGYWQVKVNGKMYLVHHIVWWIHHGYTPEYLDHIDGNPSNNAIANLRECTLSENQYNSRLSKRNTSGYKGVFWSKAANKWVAKLGSHILGYYTSIDDAVSIVKSHRLFLHGEFARDK